ncbi:ABC transporter permease [Bacteroides ovatus]|uniref:ABC transporter permease n=2 Tax=Bacteroidia TaxID=200643 RepID=UPI0035652A5B
MNMKKTCDRLITIFRREMRIFAHRPLFLFTMIVAPVLCVVFFTTLMSDGLPTKLPAGLVDEDNTHITHIVTRILGSMEETDLGTRYPSFTEARSAMQRGEIYGFFYIPKGLTEDAIANRQPRLSFYTNETYFVPGTLLMKDLRYVCELSGLALTRETLYGKGLTEKQAMGILQAIVIETHPLNNPYLDYSVYLNNILLPGILILLVMLCTTYTIGLEWKRGTQRELYSLSGCSSTVALVGKLLPQTVLFSLMFIFYDVYFYKFLMFPCNSGIGAMMLLGVVTVLAAQAFGVFLFGAFIGQMRLSMCLCSLWGILSFSLAGFTYPVPAMDGLLQKLSWLFPLRHYYLIYVNQALDGYSVLYVWPSVVALLVFLLLPCTVLWRYRAAFLKYEYKR